MQMTKELWKGSALELVYDMRRRSLMLNYYDNFFQKKMQDIECIVPIISRTRQERRTQIAIEIRVWFARVTLHNWFSLQICF